MSGPTILIVEDALTSRVLYEEFLKGTDYDVRSAADVAGGVSSFHERPARVVVVDLGLPDGNGLDLIEKINATGHSVEFVVITASGSLRTAVEAMRRGAYDFLVKPFDQEKLIGAISGALGRVNENGSRSRRLPVRPAGNAEARGRMIGNSAAMLAVRSRIELAARSSASVFVTGETGTGKELVAESIHASSGRAARPFIAVNCAAIPRDLLESELFGYVKGAFSGANGDRIGLVEAADKGTLFLDEICEMGLAAQSKLLRFLQTGRIQPVGSVSSRPVDVRIVCATNKNPASQVRRGEFREDLFYRVHVLPISMPPLRDRDEDIAILASAFLTAISEEEGKQFEQIEDDALEALVLYDWPGNVRELQNVVRHAVVMNEGRSLRRGMLPDLPAARDRNLHVGRVIEIPPDMKEKIVPTESRGDHLRPLWQVERDAINHAIRKCDGNIRRAASALGIDSSTIYRKRSQWQLFDSSRSEMTRPH